MNTLSLSTINDNLNWVKLIIALAVCAQRMDDVREKVTLFSR